jgi:hypothetical protein
MNGPALLQSHAGKLSTTVGACYPGSHAVFRGQDLHRDLQSLDWVDLYVFGITGRRLSAAQVELLHAIWVNTSYPDARLWNNRVAALAGTTRSSANLGVVAGLALSEAQVYGGLAGLRAISFLQMALRRTKAGEDFEQLVLAEARARRIYGYGRPINSTDERIPVVLGIAQKLGPGRWRTPADRLRHRKSVVAALLPAAHELRRAACGADRRHGPVGARIPAAAHPHLHGWHAAVPGRGGSQAAGRHFPDPRVRRCLRGRGAPSMAGVPSKV